MSDVKTELLAVGDIPNQAGYVYDVCVKAFDRIEELEVQLAQLEEKINQPRPILGRKSVNRSTYNRLITEDIDWLEANTERDLERDHITEIVRHSEQWYYEHDAQRLRLIEQVKELQAQLAQYECEWSPEDDYESSNWSSGCGAHWEFIDDGPVENGVEYCFRCGGKVTLPTPPEQTP